MNYTKSNETIELETKLQYSLKKDLEFQEFIKNNPVNSIILFDDYDGGFEINTFEGTVIEYNSNLRQVKVKEHKSNNYTHLINFANIINK